MLHLQSDTFVLAGIKVCEKFGHFVHAESPFSGLYVLRGHSAHDSLFAPLHPILQTQSVMRLLPDALVDWPGHDSHWSDGLASLSEYFPSGHSVHLSVANLSEYFPLTQSLHVAFPGSSLYFPGMQFVQGPPFAPEKPALHTHILVILLPIGESEFKGHAIHVLPTASDGLINAHNTTFIITIRMTCMSPMISRHASGVNLSYIQANMINVKMIDDNHKSLSPTKHPRRVKKSKVYEIHSSREKSEISHL